MDVSDSKSAAGGNLQPVGGSRSHRLDIALGDAGSVVRWLDPLPAELPVSNFLERLRDEKGGSRVYPVLEGHRPLGIVDRLQFLETMNSPYARDLFGRRPVREFVVPGTPCFEAKTGLEDVIGSLMGVVDPSRSERSGDCFLVARDGEYAGVGFVLDILGRIHERQVEFALQANPLTGLPGNAPLQRKMSALLGVGDPFRLAYCDLDNFKAFNDRYGYARGDAMILLVAEILTKVFTTGAQRPSGFVGHVGGDDFVVLAPWDVREGIWDEILGEFAHRVADLYDQKDREAGGVAGKDRRGNPVFHPLASLSIGVLPCPSERFTDTRAIAEAAAEVKHQAKLIEGNSWFQDRRIS